MLVEFSKQECVAVLLCFFTAVVVRGLTAKVLYAAYETSDQLIRRYGSHFYPYSRLTLGVFSAQMGDGTRSKNPSNGGGVYQLERRWSVQEVYRTAF